MKLLKSLLPTALLVLSSCTTTSAFWRMPCRGLTGRARLDPIVNYGDVSPHLHAILGGGNFGTSTQYEDLRASECTSCLVKQDRSAYWTPALLFMYPNGTTVPVSPVGGMLVYYLQFGENVTAFPAGFKMISGDTNLREFNWPVPDPPKSDWKGDEVSQKALLQKSLGFNCMNYDAPAEPTLFRHTMPDKEFLDGNCPDGLRVELAFPSCWNGKDLDSSNHRDHVAYSDHVLDGQCPEGFETRLPTLLFEMIYDTGAFRGVEGKFIFANGDRTGCGFHGDFLNGWDVDFLQLAINECTDASGLVEACPHFELQSEEDCTTCKFKVPDMLANDNCDGPREGICGGIDPENPNVQLPKDVEDEPAPPPAPKADEVGGDPAYNVPDQLASVDNPPVQVAQMAAITPAPSPSNACITTITTSSAGVVSEICVIEKIMYETVTIGAKVRRHVHHGHMHHHHL